MTDDDGNVILDDDQQPKLIRLRDHNIRLAAMDRLLKISERRARLLGLDTPVKQQAQEVQLTVSGPELGHLSVAELEEIKRKLYVKPTE